jgi:very-short-patch-repair endonuclease
VDGKFHDDHKQKDRDRTRDIQQQYPEVEVLRYRWKDLSDLDMMDALLCRIA